MIVLHAERCAGCGACVAACPTGALYLVEDRVALDQSLCRACPPGAMPCLAVCPAGAIVPTRDVQEAQEVAIRLPAPPREREATEWKGQPAPVPTTAVVMPALGAVLAWAGREIVPRLASYLLDSLERRAAGQRTTSITPGDNSGARPRRHRRRGGSG